MHSGQLVLGCSFLELFLLVIFYFPLLHGLNSLKQKYAVTNNYKIKLNSNLIIRNNMSALQCASECSICAACCIAGYNKGRLECHLSDDCCPITDVVNGWNMFNKEKKCESGWLQFCNYCYLIPSISLSWQNALNYCNGLKGFLMRIDSQNEHNWILMQLRNMPVSTVFVWLAAIRSNGVFVWRGENGNDIPISTSFWASGEPSGPAGVADCGGIYLPNNLWDDIRCSGTYQFVCKKLIQN